MAITEVGTVTQHGIDIGYSDTFANLYTNGNLTVDELIKYAWCASEEPYINALSNTDIDVGTQQGAATTSMLSYIQRTAAQTDYDYKFSYINDRLATGKPYSFNILVYAQDGNDYNTFNINSDTGTKYRLVTSIDSIQKIYAYVNEVNKRNASYNLPTSGSVDQYYANSYPRLRSVIDDGELYIYPMTVYVNGESFFISVGSCFAGNRVPYEGSMSDNFYSVQYDYIPERNVWLSDMTYRCSYGVLSNYEKDTFLLRWAGNDIDNFISEENNRENINYYEYSDDVGIFIKADYVVTTFTWYMFPQTEDAIYKLLALMGLKCKFETGEHVSDTLIPIISNTMVTGYTFDPDAETEFNDITDVTGNNISPTPPIPPTPSSGDDMDSQVLGATGSSGGFTKFFVMTPQDLSDFLTDFYNRADSGETLSSNLVCSYILGVPSSNWCATEEIPITINNSAQGTPFVSTANYSHVTATNNYLTIGTFDVPRKTGTFYDFAPYSTYELFIPCCGWITLPDTVAGRTIRVSLQIDIATCGAKGVVKFDDGATCAVCSGVLGSSIPMQIIESGLLRGANVQAASSALGGALMAGAGFGNGNAGIGLNGISNVVNAFTQSAIAGNTNYTNQKGSSGDITQFAMGHNCYLKITYPPIDGVVNNSMFGHTVGYLCEEVGSLSSFHGFTVCANPHVHINATSDEKEEITRLLEQGVILPYSE